MKQSFDPNSQLIQHKKDKLKINLSCDWSGKKFKGQKRILLNSQ